MNHPIYSNDVDGAIANTSERKITETNISILNGGQSTFRRDIESTFIENAAPGPIIPVINAGEPPVWLLESIAQLSPNTVNGAISAGSAPSEAIVYS